MDEERKRIAVFRFGVLANLEGGVVLDRRERDQLLREKCDHQWQISYSGNFISENPWPFS